MKFWNTLPLMACLSLTQTTAFAFPIHSSALNAQITHSQIDSQLSYANDISGGSITVDYEAKTVTLTLNHASHCPPGRFCMMMLLAPVQIELPITSVSVNACNSVAITASKDMRMVDGDLEQIVVSDNSRFNCPTLIKLVDTEAVYTTSSSGMGGMHVETRSVFYADRLQSTSEDLRNPSN